MVECSLIRSFCIHDSVSTSDAIGGGWRCRVSGRSNGRACRRLLRRTRALVSRCSWILDLVTQGIRQAEHICGGVPEAESLGRRVTAVEKDQRAIHIKWRKESNG